MGQSSLKLDAKSLNLTTDRPAKNIMEHAMTYHSDLKDASRGI